MNKKGYGRVYLEKLKVLYDKIIDEEWDHIETASKLVADALDEDRLIHVIGPGGHSFMAAEEMFYRTGGLVPINPIFEQGYSVVNGALRSTLLERLPDYVKPVLDYYPIADSDVLIVVNAYGINCATIDTVIECEKRNVKTIGISSVEFAEKVPASHPARHPTKQNLHDVKSLNVHIDNKMPYGDAILKFDGFQQLVGPVSTLVNTFVLNELVVTSVAETLERGKIPPVWTSMNTPEGAERNKEFIKKYYTRIKHL